MKKSRIAGIIRMVRGGKWKLVLKRLFWGYLGRWLPGPKANVPCGNCLTDAGYFAIYNIRRNTLYPEMGRCRACGFGIWRIRP